MSFPKDTINFKALLYALSRQSTPLPIALQQQLTEIGRSLQTNPTPEQAIELDKLIASYQPLEREYQHAIAVLQQQYTSQERTKSLGATFPIEGKIDDLFIRDILPSEDWVKAARQSIESFTDTLENRFWDKADRLAVMVAGGAAIGGAIAQVPGAIIGGLLGASYGWYLGFYTRQKSPGVLVSDKPIAEPQEIDRSINFNDIPTDEIAKIAQAATQDAVKELHQKGISTYGMTDGILYETNPVTGTRSAVETIAES